MLCEMKMESDREIILPYNYNHIVQGFLYRFINEETFSKFLHDTGYGYEKRIYKLFSFSNLLADSFVADRVNRKFIFPKEIALYVSSVDNDFFRYIFSSLIREEEVFRLGSNEVRIVKIALIEQAIQETMKVMTLSPITAYNTLTDSFGRKKTYYMNPREKDFSEYIRSNLIKKYSSYYGKEAEDTRFQIRSLGRTKEKVITYKRFIIKGHMGDFELSGSAELMEMAFCAGLGSKNSMGFGLIRGKEFGR